MPTPHTAATPTTAPPAPPPTSTAQPMAQPGVPAPVAPPGAVNSEASQDPATKAVETIHSVQRKAESLMTARPLVTLGLAAGAGALAGWWIRRR